jgi:hypothetical protein
VLVGSPGDVMGSDMKNKFVKQTCRRSVRPPLADIQQSG